MRFSQMSHLSQNFVSRRDQIEIPDKVFIYFNASEFISLIDRDFIKL